MKIALWSVGRQNESYVDEGVRIFTKRISHYFPVEWKMVPAAKNPAGEQDQREKESAALLSLVQTDDTVVVLDEKGKQFSSPALSAYLQQQANKSVKRIIFIIGGAYGVTEEFAHGAAVRWRLSDLVFPHQLVRLILAEQIYRACTILRNEKYHHS